MTKRIDHAAEARRLLPARGDAILPNHVAVAQVHATLALVEQMRIANLIALAESGRTTVNGARQALSALYDGTVEDGTARMSLRPDIAAALGLTNGAARAASARVVRDLISREHFDTLGGAMTDITTEQIVEAGAKAVEGLDWNAQHGGDDPSDEEIARAAYDAMLPLIRKQLADEVRGQKTQHVHNALDNAQNLWLETAARLIEEVAE